MGAIYPLFGLLIAGYLIGSYYRHLENPQDNVMPTLSQMLDGENGRPSSATVGICGSGRYVRQCVPLWPALGVDWPGHSAWGWHGAFPYVRALFFRFLVFFDKIPALSVLPILFIIFGLDELSK